MAITIPNELADGESIDAARLNANFDVVEGAVDKTGDTLTGTLTTRTLIPSADNTYDLGSVAASYRDLHLERNALITGTLGVGGVFSVTVVGTHSISAGAEGTQRFDVRNTSAAGTTSAAQINAGQDGDAQATQMLATSTTFTNSGDILQNASAFRANLAGGGSLFATHASGTLRFGAGGTTEWLRLGTTGNVGIAAAKKILLDGVALSGDTYIHESSANVLGLVAGGTTTLALTATVATVTGNLTASGDFGVAATKKLYLDGVALSGDTYIHESAGNTIGLVAGGATTLALNATAVTVTGTITASGNAGIAATNKIYLDGVGLSGDTYISESGANIIALVTGGVTNSLAATSAAFGSGGLIAFAYNAGSPVEISLPSRANGAGAIGGNRVIIGRNTSGGTAAGVLILTAADGTSYYIWVDTTGDLRIGTAAPEEDGTPADTSGTVVGTQS